MRYRWIALGILIGSLPPAWAWAEDIRWPVVVDEGTLFLRGEALEAPYVFTFEADTLRVNGRTVKPSPGPQGRAAITGDVTERHAFLALCFRRCEVLLEAGFPRAAVRDTVRHLLEGSPLVARVSVRDTTALDLRWEGGPPWEERVLIPAEVPPASMAWPEACEQAAGRYRDFLALGWILVIGSRGEKYFPPEASAALEREVGCLLGTGDPEAQDLRLRPPSLARDFVEVRP